MRRTKIVATIGPASRDRAVLERLIAAGANVVRLNFSHGAHEEHLAVMKAVREISASLVRPIALLQDLSGPKIRTGNVRGGAVELKDGARLVITTDESVEGTAERISTTYDPLPRDVAAGDKILLDDGNLELKVATTAGTGVECVVVHGGTLRSHKGMNLPGVHLSTPALTEKDRRDLAFGVANDVDYVALSFVRKAADVAEVKALIRSLGGTQQVIAKIEKREAVDDLDAVLGAADGVMVARGDLGVELSTEEVPVLQKHIIDKANAAGKVVITATQMLESMIRDPRPTRAEASDVANAIIDGTDAVMLSGESAVGAHPVRAVEMMARIAREVEAAITFKTYPAEGRGNAYALSEAAKAIARTIDLSCIVVLTTTGHTAHSIAAERPKTSVIAISRNKQVYHALNLFWGLKPLLIDASPSQFEELVQQAESTVLARGLAAVGDKILVIGGVPAPSPLGANFLKIHSLGAG
jgi:pyruvate kinase